MLVNAAPARDVTINDTDVFPESLTATVDGTVIFGSSNKPTIYRALPGETLAQPWIHLTGHGAVSTLGVLADPDAQNLWACEIEQETGTPVPPRRSILRVFQLRSGADKGSYPLPGSANLCNDIAVASDGTVYISDTTNSKILRLKPHGVLEVWLQDAVLEGIDGLTFVGRTLYVNSITQSKVLRIPMKADGSARTPVLIRVSRPLAKPDSMRSAAGRLYVAENAAGRVSELRLDGDTATVVTIKEGYVTPTGVMPLGAVLWVGDGKLAFRSDPTLQGQDPGPFKAYGLPLSDVPKHGYRAGGAIADILPRELR
jgi:sugar lactone lactonase YvrE